MCQADGLVASGASMPFKWSQPCSALLPPCCPSAFVPYFTLASPLLLPSILPPSVSLPPARASLPLLFFPEAVATCALWLHRQQG